MPRRRALPWVVGLGTRLYLARGEDADHAREHVAMRLGRELRAEDVAVRPATAADLELADLLGAGTEEADRWRDAVRALDPR